MQRKSHGTLYDPHVHVINHPIEQRDPAMERNRVCFHVGLRFWEERPRIERITNASSAYKGHDESPEKASDYESPECDNYFAHTRVGRPGGGLYHVRGGGPLTISVFNTSHAPSWHRDDLGVVDERSSDVEW